MSHPPPVVPRKTATLLASVLWVLGLVSYVLADLRLKVLIASLPVRLLALIGYGILLGLVTGTLEWYNNRTPYYSELKGRWFNQNGYMFPVAGILGGAMAGGLGWIEITEEGFDGAFGGAIFGGMAGIAFGVLYRVIVVVGRLGRPSAGSP